MIVKPVIKPKYRRGGTLLKQKSKYRYGGNGIWSGIGRKVFGDSAKKLINSVTKEKIAQKATSALLDGASNSVKKAAERTLDKVINKEEKDLSKKEDKTFKITQNLIDRLPPLTTTGRGIVYD